MNKKLDAALKILALAREHLPAIVNDVRVLMGPQLTAAERQQLEQHIAKYNAMSAEQRKKAGQ